MEQTQLGANDPQGALVGEQEVDQRNDPAHGLGGDGSRRRAHQTPIEDGYEENVQHHVGDTRAHRDPEAEGRPFGGDQEALEHSLEHEGGLAEKQDAAVGDAVGEHGLVSAQKDGYGLNEKDTGDGDGDAQGDGEQDQEGEVAVGTPRVALAHGLGHQSRAARSDHEARTAQDHEEGPDEIDGGEGGLTHEVGHAETVHHAVDRGEDHHDDRGEGEAEQLSVAEMLREGYMHGEIPFESI